MVAEASRSRARREQQQVGDDAEKGWHRAWRRRLIPMVIAVRNHLLPRSAVKA